MAVKPDRWKHPAKEPPKVSEQQKRLWDAVNDYVTQNGGWVVSVPHLRDVRVELPKDSALAIKLTEFGYAIVAAGTSTRVTTKGLEVVDVVAFKLPGK